MLGKGGLDSYDQRESNRGSDCACSDDCYAGGGWVEGLVSV
jgi:hypothetical protein